MHDAVADVLAQRARPRPAALPATVVVSLVLHGALFAAVWVSARRVPPPQQIPALNIRFARPATPVARPAPPAVETPAPRKEATVTPPAPQPKVETKAPPPAKKEAYAPKKESIFGRSEKDVAPPAPSPAASAQPSIAMPAVGAAGVTGLEGGEFPYTIYIDQMLAKIGRNWFRPAAPGEPLAQVYFVIERSGRIREAKITKGSGHAAFDRAAERAVLQSSPLAPLPLGYNGTWLGVHLTFH